jgi:hypothetical protein
MRYKTFALRFFKLHYRKLCPEWHRFFLEGKRSNALHLARLSQRRFALHRASHIERISTLALVASSFSS